MALSAPTRNHGSTTAVVVGVGIALLAVVLVLLLVMGKGKGKGKGKADASKSPALARLRNPTRGVGLGPPQPLPAPRVAPGPKGSPVSPPVAAANPQAMPQVRGGKRRAVQIRARNAEDSVPKKVQFEKLSMQARREQQDQRFRDAVDAGDVKADRRAKYRQAHSLDRKEKFRQQMATTKLQSMTKQVKSRLQRDQWSRLSGSRHPPTSNELDRLRASRATANLGVKGGRPLLPSQV